MQIQAFAEDIRFRQPLVIAGRVLPGQSVLCIEVRHGRHVAHAEAAGVFYRGESGPRMKQEVEAISERLPNDLLGAWREVQKMPPGGARNALDWALWQLVAAQRGDPAYRMAFLQTVKPRMTMVTLGVDEPHKMAQAALAYPMAKALKLKLDGSAADAERVAAVRLERPDVRLSIDANEGWTMPHLEWMMAALLANQVELIEQPLPATDDDALRGCGCPIALAADESLQTIDDLERIAQMYQVANIKLDKCGGLSAALTLAHEARQRGLQVMIGCMGGRSRAILPAFIAAQWADLVDLDAPLLMASDTAPSATYADGLIAFDDAAFMPMAGEQPASLSASLSPVRHAEA
ncbi:muconate cycloisomerase [Variovorax boronicumulans]|uniref:dipeptide epimerase n=1 Tax=Variovorax boronicumulans TaxID=436515 RepID=UPI002789972B|nr:dipeptide epimerase [Variovorax boronicumulans]MDP9919024.1 muconate cycloisomerase [Variovorax boronicumulans]